MRESYKEVENKVNDRLRELIMKLKKSKLFVFVFVLGILVMSGSVISIFFVGFEGTTGFVIDGGEPFTITLDELSIEIINDTSLDQNITQQVEFTNGNGIFEMEYLVNSTIDEADLGCDNSGDLVVYGNLDGTIISDGDTINITSGQHTLNVTTSILQFACEQNITTDISLLPV